MHKPMSMPMSSFDHVYVYVYVHVDVYICAYIHTYTFPRTHTHTYIIHTFSPNSMLTLQGARCKWGLRVSHVVVQTDSFSRVKLEGI